MPSSSGSAMSVSRLCLFGVSAKHCTALVSTTVSQNLTTGSLILISISAYSSRRSCITQSRYSSPVPSSVCSPLSSTRVDTSGKHLFTLRSPSSILGSSAGRRGSMATLSTLSVMCTMGRSTYVSATGSAVSHTVALLAIVASMPLSSTQLPAGTLGAWTAYRASATYTPLTVSTAMSSSSSGVYVGPSTLTD